MNIQWYISKGELNRFANACEATIRNVGRGTKQATTQACIDIFKESLRQVPRETGTLASTCFYEVQRRTSLSGYIYEGIVGYAGAVGNGYNHDVVNPKTGAKASDYATIVHEDLLAAHIIGKAKFLEDPVRSYGASKFQRVAEARWRWAIDHSDFGGQSFVPVRSD